jgi:misacylated tRNA(Ala) deacylase
MPVPTERLYWEDDFLLEADAIVVGGRSADAQTAETSVSASQAEACAGLLVAFDRTCFYPGGGGQPPDRGWVTFADGQPREVTSVRADEDGLVWHAIGSDAVGSHATELGAPPVRGEVARLRVDAGRRLVLSRYHTVLHVLNTVVLRDYAGWITGVQIGEDNSRIDFRLDQVTPALCRDLEAKVNAVIDENRKLEARFLAEAEFRDKPELLRTLDVAPPVVGGKVRVVEIEGFDAQACGGTHVHTTGEVGRFSIFRTENKGKNNKRLYVRLEPRRAGGGC